MTKRKGSDAPQVVRPRLTLETVTLQYLEDLRENVRLLREQVEFYRGKSERLELSIMNSSFQSEARIEYVERTDPGAGPSIRDAQVQPQSRETGGHKSKFQKFRDDWAKMSDTEKLEALGDFGKKVAAVTGTEPAEPAKQ